MSRFASRKSTAKQQVWRSECVRHISRDWKNIHCAWQTSNWTSFGMNAWKNWNACVRSFPSDAKNASFPDGLKVKHSKKYGKHVVTNRNLAMGQNVIVEEAYWMASSIEQNYLQCANCFERKSNLLACSKCSAIMFCSQRCCGAGHEKFHAFECGKRDVCHISKAIPRLVIRTVINAIKFFPNIEDLMGSDFFGSAKLPKTSWTGKTSMSSVIVERFTRWSPWVPSIVRCFWAILFCIIFASSMRKESTLSVSYTEVFRPNWALSMAMT